MPIVVTCILVLIILFFCSLSRSQTISSGSTFFPISPLAPSNDPYNWNNQDTIWFAQSCPLSGPSQRLGIEMKRGIEAAFEEINSLGGVWGSKKLRLLSLDDSYEPSNTKINTDFFLYNITPPSNSLNGALFTNASTNENNIRNRVFFGLIGYVGTPTVQEIFPNVTSTGIPLIGSFTGVGWLRTPFYPNIINVRSSYDDETAAMVDWLINVKLIRRISIMYQDDAFGLSGLNGIKRSLIDRLKIPLCSSGTFPRNTLHVESAFYAIGPCNPEAIVLIGTYAPLAKYIKMVKDVAFTNSSNAKESSFGYKKANDIIFLTVSFVGSAALTEDLTKTPLPSLQFGSTYYTDNVIVTQVVPSPMETSYPIVRAYQRAMTTYAESQPFTFIELEGYIVGKFVYNVLKNMVGNLTRSNFIASSYFDFASDYADNSKSGGAFIFDGIQVGRFKWCKSLNIFNYYLSSATAFNNTLPTTCTINCNQGLKIVYMSSINMKSGNISFDIFRNFSWYSSDSCISDVNTSLTKPVMIGQSIQAGSIQDELVRIGIYTAFNQRNKNSNNPIVLKTLYHTDTMALINNTRELTKLNEAVSLVAYSASSLSFDSSNSAMADLTTNTEFNNIAMVGISAINTLALRKKFHRPLIHVFTSVLEQLGAILDHSMNIGSTRFSIVYSKKDSTSFDIFQTFSNLMSSNNLNIDSECNVDGDVDNTISLQQLSRDYANPQAIIIALSNSSHILSLISSIQQTYNVHPKFRRGLVVYLINSLFDKHVEQEMSPGLSLIMQQETRFSVSYVSHIPSVNSQKTIISEFRKGILQHLPENSPHDSLYLQKILEGYYVGKMIAGLVDLQSKPSFTALDFLNSIYSISSFTVSNVTFGAFKERCNLGLRENYIYSFNASSALFEEIYVKTYDMESCGLLRYENSKRNSISSVSKDAIQQPLVLVRLIPFEENESLPRNTLTLLSDVYDSSDEYVKGLQYFINIYNTKPRTHQFQQIRLHTEYYGLRQGKYSLEAKMKAMIEKQGVFAFVGTVLTLNTSYTDINSLLKPYNVPMLTLSQSLELRSPYSKYFINLRPSILDETASMINYFQTFGSIAIVYANTFEWTNNAIPTITQYCYANDFSVVMQPFNDMKDLQNILAKIEPKSIIVLGSDKDVETALKVVGDSSSYIRNIGFLSGSYTPTLQLQMQQILYRISNKYLYLPTLTTTPKIDNDVCAQDSSYSSQQNMKTFLSYYKQSNPDLHTLEGFLTGYFIETLLERAYQLSTTVTTNDFITTIFSGRTFNLMELMEVGPFGLECSSKQISSWNFSVADGCSESTNNVDSCDCNQGPRRVLLTRLTLTNDSILYNDVNFEFTFDTCGVKIIYPILTKGQIAGICIAGVCIICFIIFVILICYKCCGRKENTKYAPQTGNITCGFTDIQNSTVLWEQNEKGMREALIIHNDILRKLLETYRGYEVKTHGDSFYVAFADAVDALDWSIAVQHALLDAEWPSSLTQMWDCRTEWDLETKQKVWNGIRVRIGLHFGHADRIFDKTMHRPDYFGTTVNMASRIENSAYGGQVLISEEMFLELWKRLGVDMFKHVIFQDYNLQSYVEEIKTKILMETNDALSDVRSSMTLDLKSLPLSTNQTNNTKDFRASISSLSSSMARKRHVSRPKYTCYDLGEFRLKGLQHMARLFEVKSDRTNKREFPAILRNLEKDPSVMSILSEGSSVETTHLRAHKFNNKVIPIVE